MNGDVDNLEKGKRTKKTNNDKEGIANVKLFFFLILVWFQLINYCTLNRRNG